jgi:hypothetical protein
MAVGTSFRLSRIVIVESLESHEVKTGAQIAGLIDASEGARSLGLTVEYHTCEHAGAFKELIHSLTLDVKAKGRIRLLHVECHGDKTAGLEFQNGSLLPWSELSDLLVSLNKVTRFNLVAVFSACYGAHFLSQLDSIEPAPCYAMIAPTDAVRNYEILSGFRTFYSVLCSSEDAGVAVDAMMRLNLEEGEWFVQQAELWYERVAIGYVETHCTNAEMKRRALRMHRKLLSEGASAHLGELRRSLVQANRSNLIGKFFERYFMTDAVPDTLGRFSAVRTRIGQRLSELRRTGRYGV